MPPSPSPPPDRFQREIDDIIRLAERRLEHQSFGSRVRRAGRRIGARLGRISLHLPAIEVMAGWGLALLLLSWLLSLPIFRGSLLGYAQVWTQAIGIALLALAIVISVARGRGGGSASARTSCGAANASATATRTARASSTACAACFAADWPDASARRSLDRAAGDERGEVGQSLTFDALGEGLERGQGALDQARRLVVRALDGAARLDQPHLRVHVA